MSMSRKSAGYYQSDSEDDFFDARSPLRDDEVDLLDDYYASSRLPSSSPVDNANMSFMRLQNHMQILSEQQTSSLMLSFGPGDFLTGSADVRDSLSSLSSTDNGSENVNSDNGINNVISPIIGSAAGNIKKTAKFRDNVINSFDKLFNNLSRSEMMRDKAGDLGFTHQSAPKLSNQKPLYEYINKHKNNSSAKVLSGRLKLAQTLLFHRGPIWVVKFSSDGRYLCSAGEDSRVIVWSVGDSSSDSVSNSMDSEDSESHDSKEEGVVDDSDKASSSSKPILISSEPYRIFEGHTSDVIDIAWSKSNFILSASLDKTVCLWRIMSSVRLQTFLHPDAVTSVEFHPIHDRYFISGCFDKKLRFWDIIPEGHVRSWAQTPEAITAVCFSPDGQTVVGGLFHGQVYFFNFDMKYSTQMDCRNSQGRFREGKKVTGLIFVKSPSSSQMTASHDDHPSSLTRSKLSSIKEKILVTTNDNRIRLCQTGDFSVMNKYRGFKSTSMQIRASISEDGKYIISGSENGKVYFWTLAYEHTTTLSSLFSKHNSYTNQSFECINSSGDGSIAVTSAVFAPAAAIYQILYSQGVGSRHRSRFDLPIESVRPRIDEALSSTGDEHEFSSRIIAAADRTGKIRIYIRELE